MTISPTQFNSIRIIYKKVEMTKHSLGIISPEFDKDFIDTIKNEILKEFSSEYSIPNDSNYPVIQNIGSSFYLAFKLHRKIEAPKKDLKPVTDYIRKRHIM